jgi:iron-sulfur cluster repair protein YtfE (RIC family)
MDTVNTAPNTAGAQPCISRDASVNDVLLRFPATAAVFNAFGIDACCGGDASVVVAATRDGADPEALLAALDQAAR